MMTGSQDDPTSSAAAAKRRRLDHQRGSSDNSDDDVMSIYSDSVDSSSHESDNSSPRHLQIMDTNNTNSNEELATCRTARIPAGVTEGQLFHVLIKDTSTEGYRCYNTFGVICPKGVKAGDTIVIVEPGSSPPLSPQQIAKRNEQRLLGGMEAKSGEWVASSFWKIVWPPLVQEGWRYEKESHYNFGSVTFYSPTAKLMTSDRYKVNQEYFESIMAVLNFIKLSSPEKKVLLDKCYADAEKNKATSDQVTADRWKYSAGIGELKHSRVGNKYQAHDLPMAGTFSKGGTAAAGDVITYGDVILETGVDVKNTDYYSIDPKWRALANDNDDTFAEEFHRQIIKTKKHFRALASYLDKPMGFCLWYYYHKYKPSAKYVELKNLLREDGNNESPGEHLDECVICDDGGDLICCDTCPNAYHLSCLGLSSTINEDEDWFCPDCTEEKTRNLSPRRFAQSPTKAARAAATATDVATATARNLLM